MDIIDAQSMGKLVRAYRKAANLTQFELADIIEIDDKQLGKIERGIHYPSVPTFLKMIKVLNINLEEFYVCPERKTAINENKILKLAKDLTPKQSELAYKIMNTIYNY